MRRIQLSDRQLVLLEIASVGYAVFLVVAAALAPAVVRNLLSASDYQNQVELRLEQGVRLQAAVQRLGELSARGEELHQQMAKVHLAYGLDANTAVAGQGGYPIPERVVPAGIYAGVIRHGARLEARLSEQIGVLETFLTEVRAFEEAHQELTRSTPAICPLRSDQFVLTSGFGARRSPFTRQLDFHSGLDLAAPAGTPVYAPADGVVGFVGRYPLGQSVVWWRYGNLVAVRHEGGFVTLYGHLDATEVKSGQRVRRGDRIATVGSTGWSINPHLHYEVRRSTLAGEWEPVDPRIYILDHDWHDQEPQGGRPSTVAQFEPLPSALGGTRRRG